MTALLVLQAAVFALWVWSAFAVLLDWRRRAVAATGLPMPGPRAILPALRGWWRDPAARRARRRLLGLTALLLVLSVLQAALRAPA